MPSKIRLGCSVSGAVGPLQSLENVGVGAMRETVAGNSSGQRRIRCHYSGVVIKSSGDHEWTVYWHNIQKCSNHKTGALKFVAERHDHFHMTSAEVDEIISSAFVPDLFQYVDGMNLTVQDANPTATSISEVANIEPNREILLDKNPGHHGNLAMLDELENPDEDLEEDGMDPYVLYKEFLQDFRQPSDSIQRSLIYRREKTGLLGKEVVVKPRSSACGLTWKVIPDVKKSTTVSEVEYTEIGVRNFLFNNKTIPSGHPSLRQYRINFLDLLIHLWPGNWQDQLHDLNERIRMDMDASLGRRRRRGSQVVKEISQHEFWVFWGIVVAARACSKKGINLWGGSKHDEKGIEPIVDFGGDMKQYRHEQIRSYMSKLFEDPTREEEDIWWRFSKCIDEFNKNRQMTVASSKIKVMDESMSAFRPQTTKTGNLPNISHILRKPEPLGSEYKVVACSKTGMFLHLEIQKGKQGMASAEFTDTLKATSACVKRLNKATKRGEDDTYLGDSWFTSIEAVENIEGRYIGIVKTAHSYYPKKELEKWMASWPAGSHLVLKTTTRTGRELLAIGYKYSLKKVICFLSTAEAGHTEAGLPYEAKWKDENNNTLCRDVPRPEICAKYFEHSNCIDVHNQSRQFDLRLEKFWITECGYFRNLTTVFGICVVDCWKGYMHHLPKGPHRHKDMGIEKFASLLAKDMIQNKFLKTTEIPSLTILTEDFFCHTEQSVVANNTAVSNRSNESDNTGISSITLSDFLPTEGSPHHVGTISSSSRGESHRLLRNPQMTQYTNGNQSGKRPKRGKCMFCGATTHWYCPTCPPKPRGVKAFVCGQKCQENHKAYAIKHIGSKPNQTYQ